MADWSHELDVLRAAGAKLEPGLTDAELSAAEKRCGVRFPSDLRELLSAALPTGERFPNWRRTAAPELAQALAWPFDGIAFDIEHNAFWWPAWGPRPEALADAIDLARRHVAEAPKLVPVYGHRYLPAVPVAAGNPVLSVYQTDVIYYGRDLHAYIAHEFGLTGYDEAVTPAPRPVPFWSDLIQANGALAG